MKAKLIESTNKMLSTGFSGREGELTIKGNAYWRRTLSDQFHTSTVVSYELLDNSVVVLHTLNNKYVFELIDCEFNPAGITDVDENIIEKHKRAKKIKSKLWSCQIAGPGFLEGLLSTVTLPEAMNKKKAEEYIFNNAIVDNNEGCLIMSLQRPLDKEIECN